VVALIPVVMRAAPRKLLALALAILQRWQLALRFSGMACQQELEVRRSGLRLRAGHRPACARIPMTTRHPTHRAL